MVILPISTDAPLYHRPLGTLGLIAVNAGCWLLCDAGTVEQWALHYGMGWTPLQWITSNFMHADFLHLLGNMFFLWGFGLIVEGKLGWGRFVALFLTMGALECATEQLLFWQASGVSLGASSAIFGLMGVSLLWAPKNELSVFYYSILRSGVTDVSVMFFSLLLLMKSALFAGLGGAVGNSEFLHLLGGGFGVILGWAFLHWRWVDCEGWDLMSVIRGGPPPVPLPGETEIPRKVSTKKRMGKAPAEKQGSPARVLDLIRNQKPLAAWQEWEKVRQVDPQWSPAPPDLLSLARALRQKREWTTSVKVYRSYLQSPQAGDPLVRLEIAEILILVQDRPQAGLHVMAPLSQMSLTKEATHKLATLQKQANQMIQDGVLEMRDDSW